MSDTVQSQGMPQTTAPQPATDDMTLDQVFKSMKRDPAKKDIISLGHDGVLRVFDAVRNVLDARGLTQPQIREYYNAPDDQIPTRLLTADGRDVSEWDKWHPAQIDTPPIPTEEQRAKTRALQDEFRMKHPDDPCLRQPKADGEK